MTLGKLKCLALLAALLGGCATASAPGPDCIRDHPRAGAPGVDATAQQNLCTNDGGTGCVATAFISEAAAVCLAKEAGLAPGINAWQSNLVYHFGVKTVRWSVKNTLSDNGTGTVSGEGIAINATTGAVMDKFGWGATP